MDQLQNFSLHHVFRITDTVLTSRINYMFKLSKIKCVISLLGNIYAAATKKKIVGNFLKKKEIVSRKRQI